MSALGIFKRVYLRIPIWRIQVKNVFKREGLVGVLKKVRKKIIKVLRFSKDPQGYQNFQYKEWIEKVESKYRDPVYLERVNKETGEKIKFSIIFPVWNKSVDMLQKALDSVMNQSYTNFEVCISDGSTKEVDIIRNFLKSYKEKYPGKVKLSWLSDDLCQEGKINLIENTNNAISLSDGSYIVFMDCDDVITVNCLTELAYAITKNPEAEFIYSDFDKVDLYENRFDPSFWPDWSPHNLLSQMYTTHITCYRKDIIAALHGLREGTSGAQDWDFVLRYWRMLEKELKEHGYTKDKYRTELNRRIIHIPKILYSWRVYAGSTAMPYSGAKDWAYDVQGVIIQKFLDEDKYKGKAICGSYPGSWRPVFDIASNPSIAIIIPFRDKVDVLEKCVSSILGKSTYSNYKIVLVNNQSLEQRTSGYLKEISVNEKIIQVDYDFPFHFGKMNNWAVEQLEGFDYVLFLNNDTSVITPGWMEEMLMWAQQDDIGAVGAKLLFPNNTVQHGGVVVGMGGAASHKQRFFPADSAGYNGTLINAHDVMGVTGACLLVKREKFIEVGMFDLEFDPAYQDVDLCIKLYERGYWNIFNPNAILYHYESLTRFNKKNSSRFAKDIDVGLKLAKKWPQYIQKGQGLDPFYSSNLDYNYEDYRLKME